MSVKIPAVTGITGSVSAQYWSLFWRGIVIIILCVMIAIGQSSKKNAKVVSYGWHQRYTCWRGMQDSGEAAYLIVVGPQMCVFRLMKIA